MKIRVIWPGKTRKDYYRLAIEDYASRIRKMIPFEIVETAEAQTRNKARRLRAESATLAGRRTASVTVTLDAGGTEMSSMDFAKWMQRISGDVDFFVGGPHGLQLPDQTLKLSLGKITMAHELARVVLMEQIYRALTIQHNIPYHK